MDQTLEQMAQSYSKKWGVSVEEAKKKLKVFIESKPEGRGSIQLPTEENPFPTPAGPLSTKFMDLNQAALSGAYTTRKLKELSLPPQDLENMKSRLDSVEQSVNATLELVNTRVKQLQDTLDTKKAEEERTKIIEELNSKVIAPMKADLETVKKAVEDKNPSGAADSMKALADKVKTAESDAVQVLRDLGYNIPPKVSVPAPPSTGTPMDTKTVIEWLKTQGYKIESDTITKEEAKKMIDEATRKAQEDVLDDKRIDAVAGIVKEAVSQMIGLFKMPLETYFKTVFETKISPGETPPST